MMEVSYMRVPTVECQAELIRFFRTQMIPSNIDRMIKGYEGECDFDRFVESYGDKDWEYIRDFNFSFHSLTQIDSIIITPGEIHVYEIKNYDAECRIQNNTFYYSEQETFSNPFVQLDNIKLRFKGLLKQIGYFGKVYFHVVMINPNCVVRNSHEVSGLIMRNEIKAHLKMLSQNLSTTHNVENYL